MIRHTILFKVKSGVSIQVIESMLKEMQALKNKLPGIISITCGECHFHDEKSTHFFSDSLSHAISIDFENQNSLNQFFTDSITHPVKSSIINMAEGGHEGLVGFDLID
jgi:hypothetical protein